ncbi:MAG: hypothetical protein DRR42_14145 [Gammaproteobacteria bacterium]|nr:MAG: hypothetical protein DRR42_14145 [Gammaproteobacteria bacterium]
MAYTQIDLDTIDAAIKSGVRRVRLNGREQEFHSAGDLLKLREHVNNELARATGSRPRSFRARTSKGL